MSYLLWLILQILKMLYQDLFLSTTRKTCSNNFSYLVFSYMWSAFLLNRNISIVRSELMCNRWKCSPDYVFSRQCSKSANPLSFTLLYLYIHLHFIIQISASCRNPGGGVYTFCHGLSGFIHYFPLEHEIKCKLNTLMYSRDGIKCYRLVQCVCALACVCVCACVLDDIVIHQTENSLADTKRFGQA